MPLSNEVGYLVIIYIRYFACFSIKKYMLFVLSKSDFNSDNVSLQLMF